MPGCQVGVNLGDGVVERQEALVDELKHHRRHKRLADATDPEVVGDTGRPLVRDVREAIRLLVHTPFRIPDPDVERRDIRMRLHDCSDASINGGGVLGRHGSGREFDLYDWSRRAVRRGRGLIDPGRTGRNDDCEREDEGQERSLHGGKGGAKESWHKNTFHENYYGC